MKNKDMKKKPKTTRGNLLKSRSKSWDQYKFIKSK